MLVVRAIAIAVVGLSLGGPVFGQERSPSAEQRAADEAFQEGSYEEAEARYAALLARGAAPSAIQFRYAYSLHSNKKYQLAVEAFRKAADDEALRASALYNAACGQARLGRGEEALATLEEALAAGFSDAALLRDDPDFDSLRGDARIEKLVARIEALAPGRTLTWGRLAERMDAEEDGGFAGGLVAVNEGEVVVRQGYGLADRAAGAPFGLQTVFPIGAASVQFTRAAILLLAEEGKLSIDDSISKFFAAVPEDKRGITIEQLMSGRSGLPGASEDAGDGSPSETLDRNLAVTRILACELLFPPDQGEFHSPLAWAALAAIVEIVSGEGYRDFVRRRLFEPLGMIDSGFVGNARFENRVAGAVNPSASAGAATDWLEMASGGIVSTLDDMHRWVEALHGGKALPPETVARHFLPNLALSRGERQGFAMLVAADPRTYLLVVTSDNGPMRAAPDRRLANDLAALVRGFPGRLPPFTLGVMLDVDAEGRWRIVSVTQDGAAEKAGVAAGDVLLSINGLAIEGDPLGQLRRVLTRMDPVRLSLQRDGQRLEIEATPRSRSEIQPAIEPPRR